MSQFQYIDDHLHFHDPDMTEPVIKKMIIDEFPLLKAFFENPDDNSSLLQLMDTQNCKKAWIINYESPDVMGYTFETNDWVSNFCEGSDKRLLPVGSIHPKKHEKPVDKIQDYFESGLLFAMKVHGPHQLVKPNAYTNGLEEQRELYEMCVDLGIPVIFHTGSSIFPKARSIFGNPLFLEDVLIDFPDLIAIMAHGGRPFWMREAEYLMAKFRDLYMDLSGIPPHYISKYFPRFQRFADRCIFGSDYPSPGVPGSRENAEAVANLPLDKDTLNKILYKNAEKIISMNKNF